MEIDNKTRAAVLREIQGHFEGVGEKYTASEVGRIADKLDPPQKPIHPHEGCDGMLVVGDGISKAYVHIDDEHSERWKIPREASKVPAFLCDGTRPEWVKDNDIIWFPWSPDRKISTADRIGWGLFENMHFCVINPVQVQ